MKRTAGFLVFLTLGALLFYWIMSWVGWNEVWSGTKGFWGSKGVLLVGLSSLTLFFGVVRWRGILRHQGYQLPFFTLCKEYVAGFSLSFFLPMVFFANEFFRAYVLRDLHEVPLQKGVVSVLIERFLEATAYLAVLIVSVMFLLSTNTVEIPRFLWWVIVGVAVLGLALIFFYLKSYRRESILRMLFPRLKNNNGFVETEQEVLRFFRLRNKAFWTGLFWSFAKVSSSVLRTFVLVAFLSEALLFFEGVAITGFTFLSLMVPIPGQLGSHEALQALVFPLLGLQGHQGAAFAFLVRASELVVASLGLVILFRTGIVLFERSLLKKLERVFAKLPL